MKTSALSVLAVLIFTPPAHAQNKTLLTCEEKEPLGFSHAVIRDTRETLSRGEVSIWRTSEFLNPSKNCTEKPSSVFEPLLNGVIYRI